MFTTCATSSWSGIVRHIDPPESGEDKIRKICPEGTQFRIQKPPEGRIEFWTECRVPYLKWQGFCSHPPPVGQYVFCTPTTVCRISGKLYCPWDMHRCMWILYCPRDAYEYYIGSTRGYSLLGFENHYLYPTRKILIPGRVASSTYRPPFFPKILISRKWKFDTFALLIIPSKKTNKFIVILIRSSKSQATVDRV